MKITKKNLLNLIIEEADEVIKKNRWDEFATWCYRPDKGKFEPCEDATPHDGVDNCVNKTMRLHDPQADENRLGTAPWDSPGAGCKWALHPDGAEWVEITFDDWLKGVREPKPVLREVRTLSETERIVAEYIEKHSHLL